MSEESSRYVALLRGINVGRARQVDMPRLREALSARGHRNVRTHLRSGNVLLDSGRSEEDLARDVEQAVLEEFGLEVPVVVRTGAEIAAVVGADPLKDQATDPARYLVTFLPTEPPADLVAALPAPPAGGEAYAVRGRELYLWLPNGVQDAALSRWKWPQLLGSTGTARNWNTVVRLAELAR